MALAKAGHRSGYRPLPVCAERKRLPPVPLRRRKSNEIRGFIPQTQLRGCRRCGTKFGAAAAALKCYAVSRVMAAMAARWHRVVCAGYFDDFGIISKGSCVQEALEGLAQLHAIVGFDLKVGGPSMGLILGATVRFGYVGGSPRARLFLDSKRAGKRMADVRTPFGAQGVILSQVRKLAVS